MTLLPRVTIVLLQKKIDRKKITKVRSYWIEWILLSFHGIFLKQTNIYQYEIVGEFVQQIELKRFKYIVWLKKET